MTLKGDNKLTQKGLWIPASEIVAKFIDQNSKDLGFIKGPGLWCQYLSLVSSRPGDFLHPVKTVKEEYRIQVFFKTVLCQQQPHNAHRGRL